MKIQYGYSDQLYCIWFVSMDWNVALDMKVKTIWIDLILEKLNTLKAEWKWIQAWNQIKLLC